MNKFTTFVLIIISTSIHCSRDVISNENAGSTDILKNGNFWNIEVNTFINKNKEDVFDILFHNRKEKFEGPYAKLFLFDIPRKVGIHKPQNSSSEIGPFEILYESYPDIFDSTPFGKYHLILSSENYLEITRIDNKKVDGFIDLSLVAENDFVSVNSGEPDTLLLQGEFSIKLPR